MSGCVVIARGEVGLEAAGGVAWWSHRGLYVCGVQTLDEEQAGVPESWELRGGEDQKLVVPLALQKHQSASRLLTV